MTNRNASKRQQMRKRRMRKRISNILSVCSVVVLLLCGTYLVNGIMMRSRSDQLTDEIRSAYHGMNAASAEAVASPAATPSPSAAPEATEAPSAESLLPTEKPLTPVDLNGVQLSAITDQIIVPAEPVIQDAFLGLLERNDDLVGWIHVNDAIDYPVVWLDDDNDFYMNHDFDGNYSDSGWIFLDKRNGSEMLDDHLLIYGHNMRRGDMFGDLDLYREREYVLDNPIIELQSIWDAEPRKYVLVSLFDASMNKSHNTYIKITNFNFETPEAKQEYIDAVCRRSFIDLPCDATSDDQLVTLVTCSYSYPNGRFLVVARELREGETAEQIAELYAAQK